MGKNKKSKNKTKKEKNFYIEIFPAKFVEYRGENKVVLDVKVGITQIERRIFDSILIKNIENPKYFAIGIRQGVGYVTINVCDANEFNDEYDKLF